MADLLGRHSEMITQLLCHVTSLPHDADVKGDIFRHTIYPSRFVVIALMFSELRWGGLGGIPPVVEDQKSPVYIGLS